MGHPSPIASPKQTPCAAHFLNADRRQRLAIDALAGQRPITHLADELDVSRKFVYQQKDKAERALQEAFAPAVADDHVLFQLPVTRRWLYQLVLALILIGHCSFRGVVELLRDLLQVKISVGTVHNLVTQAAEKAQHYNETQDLAAVRIGAHDELFQQSAPVLTGVDVDSTYCYLLSLEDQRDGDTWALRLLELQDRGFAPEATVSDAGKGLAKGHQEALPDSTHRGDVFHALADLTQLVGYLDNRAYDAMTACDKLEKQQAQHRRRHGRRDLRITLKLAAARRAAAGAIDLAESVALLSQWLQQDVLAVAGPIYAERLTLYDFLLEELSARRPLCPHRLGPVCTMLKNQRTRLLAFAATLDEELQALATEFEVPVTWVRQLLHVQALDAKNPRRWQEEAHLRQRLRSRFYHLSEAVAELAGRTVRASSVVENLNGRLRNYFYLRRHVGPSYLHLLQFFLNHRRFLRSEHAERAGKSPAELLTGKTHPHWLPMLGYQLFSRN